MENKTLIYCWIQGGDSSFHVDTDPETRISQLKAAIFAKKRHSLGEIDPDDLKLYVANIDDTDEERNDFVFEDNERLAGSDKINEHFPAGFPRKKIHFAVKRPTPPSPALASETNSHLERKLDEFEDKLLKRMDVAPSLALATETNSHLKRKLAEFEDKLLKTMDALQNDRKTSISISRITQQHFDKFLCEHNLQIEAMDVNLSLTEKDVYPFVWGDKKEDSHSDRYMEWLKANVTIPSYATLHKTSNQPNLLSLHSVSALYNFKGTLDMAIVDKRYVEKGGSIAPGLLVGIEVKKKVETKHHNQAMIELLLANVVSRYPVIMLLTDLGKNWIYFWLQKGTIAYDNLNLRRGVALLELIPSELNPSSSGKLILSTNTSSDAPYRDRSSFLAATSLDDDVDEPTTPTDGLDILRRPKIDPMTFLPQDDIADMSQVFDVMSQSEIDEWKCRRIVEYFKQTPAYQSCVVENDWEHMYA